MFLIMEIKDGLTKNGPMNVESLKSKIFITEY